MPTRTEAPSLRDTLRHLPAPVVVVTTCAEGQPRGITIGSFTSVSLTPPLVSFNVDRKAQSHAALRAAGRCAIHLLDDTQVAFANHFARPDLSPEEQFQPVAYTADENGIPILEGQAAVLHTRIRDAHPAGDHSIFVAEVERITPRQNAQGITYVERGYHAVGQELGGTALSPVKASSNGSS